MINKQLAELLDLLTQVKHQKPLLTKHDKLEKQRKAFDAKSVEIKSRVDPVITGMSKHVIGNFLNEYRKKLKIPKGRR